MPSKGEENNVRMKNMNIFRTELLFLLFETSFHFEMYFIKMKVSAGTKLICLMFYQL